MHRYAPGNPQHISRTPTFQENTSGGLILHVKRILKVLYYDTTPRPCHQNLLYRPIILIIIVIITMIMIIITITIIIIRRIRICIVKLGHFRDMCRALLQQEGIFETSQGIFATYRAFVQHCVGHFCRNQRATLSAARHGSEVGYISFNSTIS